MQPTVKDDENMNDDCLRTLEIVGKTFVLTPIIVALPLLAYAIITGKNIVSPGPGAGYSAGLMISAGIFLLIYVSYKIIRK
ncbi:MAG: hypothetical protein ACC612_12135 [Methanomethylovorans sp.]|uniref:hypothetical protein n=1 Tax=Methanomethylovorans sp. TaxID=2758717 RepID=UPI0035314CC9